MKLPEAFLDSLPIPLSEIPDFQDALHTELKSSIRVNPFKARAISALEKVPWSNHGYYLDRRPRFTSNPPFHAGAFYPQEASSMFVSHILKQLNLKRQAILALDLCAAPGGKTTLLQSDLHMNSLIQANETIQSRFKILQENTAKWGLPNICISNNDPADFKGLDDFYDLILVDAPCSGEGLFRKQMDAINHWSPNAVEHCSARQRRILSDIWPSLKHEGILIYSTCTYNRLENEENLKWLQSQRDLEFVNLDISDFSGIQKVDEKGIFGYRFFPHKIQGEGFFCSVIRKVKETKPKVLKVKNRPFKLLNETDSYAMFALDEKVFGICADQMENLMILRNHFNKSLLPGLELGRILRNSIKYEHGMAMSVGFDNGEFKPMKLTLNDSLRYLKKEDVSLKVAEGRYLIEFQGFNLGFAKSDSRRLISQYPKSWRILNAKEEEYTSLVESLK